MKNGEIVVEPKFEDTDCFFSDGLLIVKLNGLIGFIDVDGNMVIEPKCKDPYNQTNSTNFKNGTCQIDTGILITIDKSGKALKKEKWDDGKAEWVEISDDTQETDKKNVKRVEIEL